MRYENRKAASEASWRLHRGSLESLLREPSEELIRVEAINPKVRALRYEGLQGDRFVRIGAPSHHIRCI